jgi:GT2 family glycosyltransferase
MVDLVTIVHNDMNRSFAERLRVGLELYEPDNYRLIVRDNFAVNLGFAKGCNWGAKQATSDIIGFVNPDVLVNGSFITTVESQFLDPKVVITGCTFRKGKVDQSHNGLTNWVCGAALFVRRDWFVSNGGFFEGYVWSWEETDLCRTAESQGLEVKPILLPLVHDRSHVAKESLEDKTYKDKYFREGAKVYRGRWN